MSTTTLRTRSGAKVRYVLIAQPKGQFAPALELPNNARVWIAAHGGESRRPIPAPKPVAQQRIEAHQAAGYWRTAANPGVPPEAATLLRPGMHVRELNRPEGGGVVQKIRPQGMVVVQERDGYTRQRPADSLVPVSPARRNPKVAAKVDAPKVRAISVDDQYIQRNVAGVLRSGSVKSRNPKQRIAAAFRIALKSLQKHGYVVPGTTKLTAKGRVQAQRLAAEPEHLPSIQAYELALARARKGHTARIVSYAGHAGFFVQPGAVPARTLMEATELAAGGAGPDLPVRIAEAQAAVMQIKADKRKPASRGKKGKMSKGKAKTPSAKRVAQGQKAAAVRKRGPGGAFIKGNPVARGFAVMRSNGRSPTASLVEKMKRKGHLRASSEGGVEMVFLPEHDLVMAVLSSDHLKYLKQSLPTLARDWIVEERAVERRIDPDTLREYAARGMRVILAEATAPGVKLLANHAFPEDGVAAIKGAIYRDKRTGVYKVGGMNGTFRGVSGAVEARDLLLRRGVHFGGRWSSGGRA